MLANKTKHFTFKDFQPRPEAILCEATSFLHEYQILVTHLFFFFFFFFLGFRLVCIALEHIKTFTYTFVLLFHYFNSNSTFSVKKKCIYYSNIISASKLYITNQCTVMSLFSQSFRHLSSPQSSLPSFTMFALSSIKSID